MRKILPNEVGFGYGTKVTFLYIGVPILYHCLVHVCNFF